MQTDEVDEVLVQIIYIDLPEQMYRPTHQTVDFIKIGMKVSDFLD